MKKENLLKRAELKKVMGGASILIGCEVLCYDWTLSQEQWNGSPYVRVYTENCTHEAQLSACKAMTLVYESCGNCTMDEI